MLSFILNNKGYMNLLTRLGEEHWYQILSSMPGNMYEKAEACKRIRKIKRGRIIVHIPHSSLTVPESFIKRLKVDEGYFNGMNVYESDFLIDMFRPDDLECLIFPYSRMFCDVERFRDDHKESNAIWRKRGVVYERDANSNRFIDIDPEYKNMVLTEYYDRHHSMFLDMVRERINRYGDSLIIDLHSYSDEYERRTCCYKRHFGANPDICIGFNDFEGVKELAGNVQRLCNRYGYTNSFNYPYEGSIVPLDYLDDRRVKSIMLEINKRIYLNNEMNALNQYKAEKLRCFINDFYTDL